MRPRIKEQIKKEALDIMKEIFKLECYLLPFTSRNRLAKALFDECRYSFKKAEWLYDEIEVYKTI